MRKIRQRENNQGHHYHGPYPTQSRLNRQKQNARPNRSTKQGQHPLNIMFVHKTHNRKPHGGERAILSKLLMVYYSGRD